MRFFKGISLIIVFSIFLLFFNNCTNKENLLPADKVIKMMFWASAAQLPMYQEIKSAFEKKYPDYKLKLYNFSWQGYNQKLISIVTGGDVPDVLKLYELSTYADKGTLMSLDDFIKEDKSFDKNQFVKDILKAGMFNNKIYALPVSMDTTVLFVNKELFRKANIKIPYNGWTWSEFVKIARKLTDKKHKIYGFTLDINISRFYSFIWSNGGKLLENNKINFTSKNVLDVLNSLVELRIKDNVIPSLQGMMEQGNVTPFFSGKIAMYLGGRYFVPELRKAKNLDWDVVPLPYFRKRADYIYPNLFGIPSGAKNKKGAWKLLKFLTLEEGADIVMKYGDSTPTLKRLLDSKAFLEWGGKNNKIFRDAIKDGRFSKIEYISGKRKRVEDILNQKLWLMFLGTEKVAQAAKDAEKRCNDVLSAK